MRGVLGGNLQRATWATGVLTAALVLSLLGGVAAAHPAPKASNGVVAIDQDPGLITAQSPLTVSMEVASTSGIQQVYFTFCDLSYYICFLPTPMTLHGSNWYVGTTHTIAYYHYLKAGNQAGYNITIQYTNGTNASEPSLPNSFGNLSVTQTTTGEYEFEITVSNQTYGLTGQVANSTTGAGVAGANVTLTNATMPPGHGLSALTNSAGTFSFQGLFNGSYTLSVTAAGYAPTSATIDVSGQNLTKSVALLSAGSTYVPPPKGGGGGGSGGGWLGSAGNTGILVLGTIGVVMVALVAFLVMRRNRGAGPSSTVSPPGTSPPSPPTTE